MDKTVMPRNEPTQKQVDTLVNSEAPEKETEEMCTQIARISVESMGKSGGCEEGHDKSLSALELKLFSNMDATS